MQPMTLPRRIWIVGPCGAGKSTIGQALGDLLDVPYAAIDDLHWLPDWVERPRDDTQALVEQVAEEDAWVIDGNYTEIRRELMHRADLLLWLDLPLRVTLPRLLSRTFARSLKRLSCCNGNQESLHRAFLDRESILLWALTSDARRRGQLEEDCRHVRYVRLRTQAEIDAWLEAARRLAATA